MECILRIAARCVSSKIITNLGPRSTAAFNTKSRLFSVAASTTNYEFIKTERVGAQKNIALITFNKPKVLNALCLGLVTNINDAVGEFEKDKTILAIILTGSEKAFAAGADVKEMNKVTSYSECVLQNYLGTFDRISKARKPIIAAVNGYALGGGCEVAMMCDIIYASEKAWFAQPEINLGTIPGAGGTQRLTKCIGKSKAMELILTGNHITAKEAEEMGLVSKVFPPEQLIPETIKLAEKIASQAPLAVILAKEAVKRAFETTLEEGLIFEKHTFHATFATKDRLEGMTAFIEKRPPKWSSE